MGLCLPSAHALPPPPRGAVRPGDPADHPACTDKQPRPPLDTTTRPRPRVLSPQPPPWTGPRLAASGHISTQQSPALPFVTDVGDPSAPHTKLVFRRSPRPHAGRWQRLGSHTRQLPLVAWSVLAGSSSSCRAGSRVACGGGRTGHRQPCPLQRRPPPASSASRHRRWERTPGGTPAISPRLACPRQSGGRLGSCPHELPCASEITTRRRASRPGGGKSR